jgi:hypothetical protein
MVLASLAAGPWRHRSARAAKGRLPSAIGYRSVASYASVEGAPYVVALLYVTHATKSQEFSDVRWVKEVAH